MLDTDVAHVRVDSLREFLKEHKEEAEQRRVEAVEQEQSHTASKSIGEVEAYEEVLLYLDTMTGDRDGKQLDKIR